MHLKRMWIKLLTGKNKTISIDMFVSRKLRADHIVDYVIYMWQVEDLIRACNLDIDLVRKTLLPKYDVTDEEKRQLDKWYSELVDMMLTEGLREKGHLNIVRIVMMQLEELHHKLLSDQKEQIYASLYYQVLPYIVGLRKNSTDLDRGEIETCMDALYGFSLLKMQGKDVSKETTEALSRVGNFLTFLSERYKTKDDPEEDMPVG